MNSPRRSRVICAVLIAIVIALGLGTRPLGHVISRVFAKALGDGLWTVCAYLCLAFLSPCAARPRLACTALAISYAVEFSQLYHAPWTDAIRRTTLGGLILGWRFSWRDLVPYTIGAALCCALDRPRAPASPRA